MFDRMMFVAGVAVLALTSSVMAQDAVPDITGTWTGTFIGGVRGGGGQLHERWEEPRLVQPGDITYTLSIDEQVARGFSGSFGADVGAEALAGVIRLDNVTILTVDDDTTHTGLLLSENEMEFCSHTLNIDHRLAYCLLLTRE